MSKKYESMLIFSPELVEKETTSEIEKLTKKISSLGGNVTYEDFWGKRKFAYMINKFESGYYLVIEFELDPSKVKDLEKYILIGTNILRHIIINAPNKSAKKAVTETKKPKRVKSNKDEAKEKSGDVTGKNKEESGSVNKEMLDEKLEKILSDDLDI